MPRLIDLLKIIDNMEAVISIESFTNLVAIFLDLLFLILEIHLIILSSIIN